MCKRVQSSHQKTARTFCERYSENNHYSALSHIAVNPLVPLVRDQIMHSDRKQGIYTERKPRPLVLHETCLEKIVITKSFPCCAVSVDNCLLRVKCLWWQKTSNTQTCTHTHTHTHAHLSLFFLKSHKP